LRQCLEVTEAWVLLEVLEVLEQLAQSVALVPQVARELARALVLERALEDLVASVLSLVLVRVCLQAPDPDEQKHRACRE